ncbi:hypothetical protein VP1G_10551 [Cytospora mali]|uniref:Uncharacterized protein n=1 Tax=Cytospora mali TaxID=578113 RepID=A0A194UMX5_CYTMA|nr:hypothetical protein VP1G_10551 [Valsa mali var. pyri (nom. inval.)]
MDDENLQSRINRLSHDEMVKILSNAAANPEVRDRITGAVGTSEPASIRRRRNNSSSTTSAAPPPYSSTMSLSSYLRRRPLTYHTTYRLSRTPNVPPKSPCVCKNCKRMFWSHEQSMPVTDCIGHPGESMELL